MDAAARWAWALASWALPQELLDAGTDDPWRLDAERFRARAEAARERRSPADDAALEALPRGGEVLDVGCGAGAGSSPLVGRAGRITGVDSDAQMLAAAEDVLTVDPGLLRRVRGRSTSFVGVEGEWPDVAGDVGPADVVVSHDVAYNVPDLAAFVVALTEHARERAVLVLPERHPLTWLTPYFEQLHGLGRPNRPSADLAADVVRGTGSRPTVLHFDLPLPQRTEDEWVDEVARRCLVDSSRRDEVVAAVRRTPPPASRRMAALVWDGSVGAV